LTDLAPDQDIEEFLQTHHSPLYFTFGSMLVPDQASWSKVYETWLQTTRELGCSAIFQLPIDEAFETHPEPNILIIKRAQHNTIFPSCRAVIHHGGAGTTQSTLLAGCPSVVVAHIADQPFWGSELKRLGVSPGFMRKSEMTSLKLVKLISKILKNSAYQENAKRISMAMRQENAIESAVNILNAFTQTHAGAVQ
jgi:UDP:flavonoid glycosyltransferase YjiC (YdhE family)